MQSCPLVSCQPASTPSSPPSSYRRATNTLHSAKSLPSARSSNRPATNPPAPTRRLPAWSANDRSSGPRDSSPTNPYPCPSAASTYTQADLRPTTTAPLNSAPCRRSAESHRRSPHHSDRADTTLRRQHLSRKQCSRRRSDEIFRYRPHPQKTSAAAAPRQASSPSAIAPYPRSAWQSASPAASDSSPPASHFETTHIAPRFPPAKQEPPELPPRSSSQPAQSRHPARTNSRDTARCAPSRQERTEPPHSQSPLISFSWFSPCEAPHTRPVPRLWTHASTPRCHPRLLTPQTIGHATSPRAKSCPIRMLEFPSTPHPACSKKS